MLGKLFKYDFRSIARLNLPATILVAAMTAMGAVAMRLMANVVSEMDTTFVTVAAMIGLVIITFTAILGILAYLIICFISVYARFYKNFFTDEGYLTFTLPVKTHTLVISKLLAGFLWEIITIVITGAMIMTMVFIGTASSGKFINIELFKSFVHFLRESFETITSFPIFTLSVITQWLTRELLIFLAITIGSTVAKKQKILASVGFYFALNSGLQIASTVITMIAGLGFGSSYGTNALLSGTLGEGAVVSFVLGIVSLFYTVVIVAEYIIINSIIKKKLNLA